MGRIYVVLIPAYKPDIRLVELLKALHEDGFRTVTVDDGSGEEHAEIFKSAGPYGTILHHEVNMGKGAAIKTGLKWIKENISEPYIVVTADADGQHIPEDIEKVVAIADAHDDCLVLGSRSFRGDVPLRSRFGNALTRGIFFLSTGVRIYDTQTGLRAFSEKLAGRMVEIKGDRYEYEMKVLMEMSRDGIRMLETPISTIYLDGNSSSHFNVLKDSVRIYGEILKFSASSILSFLVDFILFTLLSAVTGNVLFSNISARIVSGTVNYSLNRKAVFGGGEEKGSLLRYIVLAFVILGLNSVLLVMLTGLLGWDRYISKLLTEGIMFLFSYAVQRRFVFRRKRDPGTE